MVSSTLLFLCNELFIKLFNEASCKEILLLTSTFIFLCHFSWRADMQAKLRSNSCWRLGREQDYRWFTCILDAAAFLKASWDLMFIYMFILWLLICLPVLSNMLIFSILGEMMQLLPGSFINCVALICFVFFFICANALECAKFRVTIWYRGFQCHRTPRLIQ